MQKSIRISLKNRRHTLYKSRAQVLDSSKTQRKRFDEWQVRANKITSQNVKDERKQRREDWISGPLAPDRDTGLRRGALGTSNPVMNQRPNIPREKRGGVGSVGEKSNGDRWNWVGEGNEGNIVVGDRVVVIRGEEGVTGRIGKVKEVDERAGTCVIEGLNEVCSPKHI